jgi:hypothetical protein
MRSLLLLPLLTAAHGASLLTLSNPVADGAIVTTAGNNDRSDWTTTTAFPTDADESYATDFQSITIAHDSARFYIREQFYRTSNSGFFAGNQILLFDTDQSSGSGYTGPGGTYSIGAEYLLEGTNLYAFTGGTSQSAFLWDYLGSVSYDDFPYNDHELSFSRSLIGSPETFDFIAVSDYFGGADLYPDSANGGDSGGYYTYTVVPEPTTGLLGLVAALRLMRRRREP